ncbi:MAG: hypothetical protein ACLUNZ_13345 [Evtepia sp.]
MPVGEDQKQHVELCRDIAAALQRRVRRHLHAARAVYPEDGRARDEPRRPDEQDVRSPTPTAAFT